MWVEHIKSQATGDRPSLKWAWSRHVIQVQFQDPENTNTGLLVGILAFQKGMHHIPRLKRRVYS